MRPGFFAGLVAGEGCFIIAERNGGQNWHCSFSLNLRADDTPLLRELQEHAAYGRLSAVPARGRSKPQVVWTVRRADECSALAARLLRNPLLNKKAGDVALWEQAVNVWRSQALGRWSAMARLARDLRAHRGFGDPWRAQTLVDISLSHVDQFLGGFATAEAHFGAAIPPAAPSFRINLRRDDRPILDFFAVTYGIGRVREYARTSAGLPVASWYVKSCDDLLRLASILDRNPPRGRQGRVYRAWRELLDFVAERRGRRCTAAEKMHRRELAWLVRVERAYARPEPLPDRDRGQETRDRCVVALRQWAHGSPTSYTATSYVGCRGQETGWPTRNTIARAFGSWHAALEAAGLPTDDCHSPERAAAIGASNAAGAAVAREDTRRAILHAVRHCADDLGTTPRATQFFRWRVQHAPQTPSQMTLYRTFPGGWDEVLAAVGGSGLDEEGPQRREQPGPEAVAHGEPL